MPPSRPLLLATILLLLSSPALALIEVSLGNSPTNDQNWPLGALDVANLKTRVGFYVGPPLGGGQYHFCYRGDTADFQHALDLFSKIRAPHLELHIHEGPHDVGFMKDANDPKTSSRVDWTFIVWEPRSWHQLYNNPKSTFLADRAGGRFRSPIDPPRLDVYIPPDGKGIDWKQVKLPPNVQVTDERASANGYAPGDGSVIRADIYDMITSKPIPTAKITVEKHANQKSEVIASVPADKTGRLEIKKLPPGSYQITASADGYATRFIGYEQFGSDTLKRFDIYLSPSTTVKGSVADPKGKPLPGVKVRTSEILAADGRGYAIPFNTETTTDNQGRFEIPGLPPGHLVLWASLKDHHQIDPFKLFAFPGDDPIILKLATTGGIKGRVLKPDGTPNPKAQVHLDPLGGSKIGSYGGSMNVQPDGSFAFPSVPPGKYILSTIPDHARKPGDPFKPIEVKPGETVEQDL